jgi:KUP system potassium uptake protein
MGHFGLAPIRKAWYYIAYPGLLLNYFGQGALLIVSPESVKNPFYLLAPEYLLYPLVAVSTLATVVASQAVISGAFSLTSQAIKLGLMPRMPIEHTSTKNIGQIYVSRINWSLLLATIWLVVEFGSSSNLAAAYGIAVSSTMVITTLLTYVVMRNLWGWKRWSALSVAGAFIVLDMTFFSANIIKVFDGGWFPLAVAFVVFFLMVIWQQGRTSVRQQLARRLPALNNFITDLPELTPLRVPGIAIYMSSYKDLTPPALLYNLKHNRVVHDTIVLLTIETEEVPYVSPIKRLEIQDFGRQIFQIILHYGFKDNIDLKRAFKLCQAQGLEIDLEKAVFFLGRERAHYPPKKGLSAVSQRIFGFMLSTNQDASAFFGIRAEQMIELGFQVDV